MGPEAARRQRRDRRAGAGLLAAAAAAGAARDRRRLPAGDAGVRLDAQPRRLVRADRRRAGARGSALAGRQAPPARDRARPRQGRSQGQPARPAQAHPHCGRGAADRQRPAPDHPGRGADRGRRCRGATAAGDRRLPGLAQPRPAPPRRVLPLRPRGPQGGRRRQRRHPCLDRPAARQGLRRPALPPGQGSRALGAGGAPGSEPLPAPRPPRGRGAAADAGGERRLPRLGLGAGGRRGPAQLLRAAALGRQGVGRRRPLRPRTSPATAPSARPPSPAHTPARAIASASPHTSARATPSTRRWRASPRPTPTRTNATTRGSPRPPRAARSRSSGDL